MILLIIIQIKTNNSEKSLQREDGKHGGRFLPQLPVMGA